jgi:hypothetical protein
MIISRGIMMINTNDNKKRHKNEKKRHPNNPGSDGMMGGQGTPDQVIPCIFSPKKNEGAPKIKKILGNAPKKAEQ